MSHTSPVDLSRLSDEELEEMIEKEEAIQVDLRKKLAHLRPQRAEARAQLTAIDDTMREDLESLRVSDRTVTAIRRALDLKKEMEQRRRKSR